jgi:hypothetical protein
VHLIIHITVIYPLANNTDDSNLIIKTTVIYGLIITIALNFPRVVHYFRVVPHYPYYGDLPFGEHCR